MELITPAEAARMLKLNRMTVVRKLEKGQLPGIVLFEDERRTWRIEKKKLEEFIRQRERSTSKRTGFAG